MIDKPAPIEKLTIIEPPRPSEGEQDRAVGHYRMFRLWRLLKFIIAAAFVLIALCAVIPGWIQKWLWMRQLGYVGIFWTIWSVRWELFAAAFVVALLYLGINLRFAQKNGAALSGGKLRSPYMVTLDEAIQAVFGTRRPQTPGQPPGRPLESGQARAAFDKAQKAMEQGDWGNFGKAMDALKGLLSGPPK